MELKKQKECIELLIKVDTIFKKNNIPYWLDGGTLLCAYRDGNLDNEYDIDIGIFGEDYEKVVALNPMFQKTGYGALDYRTKLYNVIFSTLEPSNEDHLLDMVTWYKLDDNIRSCLGERLPFTMPLDFFELSELTFYKLSSYKFPVPIKTKEYLERHFGKEEWKTPMTDVEYTKFQEDCIRNINKRPEVNKPYPNHKKLWETKISELDMDSTSFTPSINLATVEAGLLGGAVAEKKEILLHLGSGDIYLDSWINCDLENEKADVLMDCRKIPLPDNSVQVIYNSHLLEHFDFMEGQTVLKEWYRVLIPGGKLITETPDLLGLCQRFARSSEQGRVDLYGLLFGCPWLEGWNIHKFLYSETQLRWTLENLGFKDIIRVPADSHFVPPEMTDVFLKLEAIKGSKDTDWQSKVAWRHPLTIAWNVYQKPTELFMLSDFLKGNKIKKILEIGSARGGTALYWANMIGDDGIVYSVDIANEKKCYVGTEFEKQIIEMVGDTHDVSFKQKICDEVGEVDVLFIDGDHTKEGVKDDFNSFKHLVRKGGFIVLHDIIDSEYHRANGCFVALFWNEIKDQYKTFEFVDSTTFYSFTPIQSMGIGVIEI